MFIIDQFVDIVLFGKAVNEFLLVLIYSPFKVVGHANIHHFVVPVGENVNIKVVFFHDGFQLLLIRARGYLK